MIQELVAIGMLVTWIGFCYYTYTRRDARYEVLCSKLDAIMTKLIEIKNR